MRNFFWTDIVFDTANQLHVLRHFYEIDNTYKSHLIEEENISENEIIKMISIPGSKFSKSFISNPLDLLYFLGKNIPQSALKLKKERCEINYKVNKQLYPDGIGNDNLIPIANLSERDKTELKYEQREDFHIFSIQKEIKVPTWQINCVFVKEYEHINIKTIFPGIMAPPFPDKTYQTEKEFRKNIAFWNEYAFIK